MFSKIGHMTSIAAYTAIVARQTGPLRGIADEDHSTAVRTRSATTTKAMMIQAANGVMTKPRGDFIHETLWRKKGKEQHG